jgi:hypothetical protein
MAMARRLAMALVALALTVPAAEAARTVGQTRRQAEVNVLRVLPHKWKIRQLHGLVNPRTHLLTDDTEAVCRGRGKPAGMGLYTRFVCVVRPHVHINRQGLYLRYRALSRGRFTLRWLEYRYR